MALGNYVDMKNSYRAKWRDFKVVFGISRPRGPRVERLDLNIRPIVMTDRPPSLSYDFYFNIFVGYIRHENELINHRTTWFIAMQTIIGAAIGYIISKGGDIVVRSIMSNSLEPDMKVIEFVTGWLSLSLIGIVTSAAARNSIDAAIYSQDVTALIWEKAVPSELRSRFPDLMGGDNRQNAIEGSRFASHLPTFAWLCWTTLFLGVPVAFVIKFAAIQVMQILS